MSSFIILLGCFLLSGRVLGEEATTMGDSGDDCGDHKCIEGKATCQLVNGTETCVCDDPPFKYGDGRINCYKENSVRAEIRNDPNVVTYEGEEIPLQLPCRFFWTHVKTELKDRTRTPVGNCYFEAYAFHHKHKGKFFVAGYDVAIRIQHNNGSQKVMSIRFSGKASDGTYDFTVNGTDNEYWPSGDWYDDHIHYYDPVSNLRVKYSFDAINNLAILSAKKCGAQFQFRPYDCKLGKDQPMIPHFATGWNCAFKPHFLNKDKVVALPPSFEYDGKTIDDVLVPGLPTAHARELTLLVRAIRSMAAQNSPQPNPQCALTAAKMDNCNAATLVDALVECRFILTLPRFIRCMDDTTSGWKIMSLYNKCIDVYCNNLPCSAVTGAIILAGCDNMPNPYTEVTTFLSGTRCP